MEQTLKTLNTFGSCQRPVFFHLVYLNICIQNGPVKKRAQLVIKVEKKKTLDRQTCASRCVEQSFSDYLSEKLLLSQKLRYVRGVVYHNVLPYQQLSVARYQVSFKGTRCLGSDEVVY